MSYRDRMARQELLYTLEKALNGEVKPMARAIIRIFMSYNGAGSFSDICVHSGVDVNAIRDIVSDIILGNRPSEEDLEHLMEEAEPLEA